MSPELQGVVRGIAAAFVVALLYLVYRHISDHWSRPRLEWLKPRAPLQRVGLLAIGLGLALLLAAEFDNFWSRGEFARGLLLQGRALARSGGFVFWVGVIFWLAYPLLARVARWIRWG